MRGLEGDPIRQPLCMGPALLPPPPRYPTTERLMSGYPPDRMPHSPLPGESFDPTPGWLRAVGDALLALVPFPLLPAPLTEDHRDGWPQLYPDEEA